MRYPIYAVKAEWIQDGKKHEQWPWQWEGLPAGRIRNRSSWIEMRRTPVLLSQLQLEKLEEWFPRYVSHSFKKGGIEINNPSDLKISVEFVREEEWCLQWFGHYTFDVGQTDAEVMKSFSDYVDRIQEWNLRRALELGQCHLHEVIPLMGAEESWRWKGENNGDPPCRCEGCKKNGVIRIVH